MFKGKYLNNHNNKLGTQFQAFFLTLTKICGVKATSGNGEITLLMIRSLIIDWVAIWKRDTHCEFYISRDDVIIWKHFPRYWPSVGEFTGFWWIPHTKANELWCFLSSASELSVGAGDLRRHRAYYDVTIMTHSAQDVFASIFSHCFKSVVFHEGLDQICSCVCNNFNCRFRDIRTSW